MHLDWIDGSLHSLGARRGPRVRGRPNAVGSTWHRRTESRNRTLPKHGEHRREQHCADAHGPKSRDSSFCRLFSFASGHPARCYGDQTWRLLTFASERNHPGEYLSLMPPRVECPGLQYDYAFSGRLIAHLRCASPRLGCRFGQLVRHLGAVRRLELLHDVPDVNFDRALTQVQLISNYLV